METTQAVMFVIDVAIKFAVFLTVVDYWWDTKSMVEELWGRRVLGDDVWERNAKPIPPPPQVWPMPVKAIPVPKPPVVLEKTWPLLEVDGDRTIVIRAAKKPKAVASMVTIAPRNFIPASPTHKVIGIPPNHVVDKSPKEEIASNALPWEG